MEEITQRNLKAGHKAPPATTAARSVFDLARGAAGSGGKAVTDKKANKPNKPNKPKLPPPPATDPNTVPIERNAPKPAIKTCRGGMFGFTPTLLARMRKGDMVRLHPTHAATLTAHARKVGIQMSLRTLGPDVMGVWRES